MKKVKRVLKRGLRFSTVALLLLVGAVILSPLILAFPLMWDALRLLIYVVVLLALPRMVESKTGLSEEELGGKATFNRIRTYLIIVFILIELMIWSGRW